MSQQGSEESIGERRTSTRFRIHAPAIVKLGAREIWAFSRDISTRAVYFRTVGEEETPPIGQVLEFVIKIPPSMSYSKPCFIKGRGHTIRIDDLGGDETGVVVEILDYDIESEPAQANAEEHSNSGGLATGSVNPERDTP